jgi:hypothetical protein
LSVHSEKDQGAAVEQATGRKRGKRGGQRRGKRAATLKRIHAASRDRQQAWADGARPSETERQTTELTALYGDLRGERQQTYTEATKRGLQLEGSDVRRVKSRRLAA